MKIKLICILFSAIIISVTEAGRNGKALLKYLFNVNRTDAHLVLERPVKNDLASLEVRFKLTLQQITELDEKKQILKTNVWLDLKWKDYHFVWDPEKFGGLNSINIPTNIIWLPDIYLYNSASSNFDNTYLGTNVVISNDGSVVYVPPAAFESTCAIDVTWFPFDTQICTLKFGSWTYDGGGIDFKLQCLGDRKPYNESDNCQDYGSGDLSTYMENGEWELKSLTAVRTLTNFACCPNPFIDIRYNIKIKRLTKYYIFNLILPCVLISTMALLTFILPSDSSEKVSLSITVLLAITVFLILLTQIVPATSYAVPLIGIYFACIMIACSLSLVFTVFVLNVHHRGADRRPVPYWVKQLICTWLARALCCMRKHERKKNFYEVVEVSQMPGNSEGNKNPILPDPFHKIVVFCGGVCRVLDWGSRGVGIHQFCETVPQNYSNTHAGELTTIVQELRFITNKMKCDEEDDEVASEWKFCARVVDRLCLIVFCLFLIISTCAIFFSAP